MTPEEWRLLGRAAGWAEQCNLKRTCGRCDSQDIRFYHTGVLGLGDSQFECDSCRLRGAVGPTYGHAVKNWNAACAASSTK